MGVGDTHATQSIALSYEMNQSGRQEPEQVGPVGCDKSDNLLDLQQGASDRLETDTL